MVKGLIVKGGNGVVHLVALGVHVDEAGYGERGVKEAIGEHVGVDLLALFEALVASTCLQ